MRNMSFMLTPQQIMNKTKTVTRRNGWWNLKSAELVQGVKKCQGLRKGEKIERLRVIRIEDTRSEPLEAIEDQPNDLILEGFPQMTAGQFIDMFIKSHKGVTAKTIINRIAFDYADKLPKSI